MVNDTEDVTVHANSGCCVVIPLVCVFLGTFFYCWYWLS